MPTASASCSPERLGPEHFQLPPNPRFPLVPSGPSFAFLSPVLSCGLIWVLSEYARRLSTLGSMHQVASIWRNATRAPKACIWCFGPWTPGQSGHLPA